MKAIDLKRLAKRHPFRPFGVRLSNGARYLFNEPRQFGAPEDFHMIFFFGKSEAVRQPVTTGIAVLHLPIASALDLATPKPSGARKVGQQSMHSPVRNRHAHRRATPLVGSTVGLHRA